jgi:uncharacterized protein YraI
MTRPQIKSLAGMAVLVALLGLAWSAPAVGIVQAQQPTGSIPTVTGTPRGPYVTVNMDQDFIYVRSGPSSYYYPKIGILLRGQSAPALGRSPGGEWIQIRYLGVPGDVGWIYGANVTLSDQALVVVPEPPTSTIPVPTIKPALATAFLGAETPTRLPTFTPAADVNLPNFGDDTAPVSRVPLGLIIFVLGFVGAFITIISILRGR